MLATRLRLACRRLSVGAAALLIATAGLIGSPTPVAAAAHAAPWRFTTLVSADESIAAYDGTFHTGDYYLQCPAGYIPVSGGVKAGANAVWLARLLEWPDATAGGYYHITLINEGFPAVNFTISATCVWADDVGAITYVNKAFTRNANGWAGGELLCPNGTTTFSAGFDWSVYGATRTVNYSRPVTRGSQNGQGWYVAGYSPSNGATLGLSLRCVDVSLLSAEAAVTADGSTTSGATTAVASCATGYRLLTGGVGPTEDNENAGVDQGWGVSGPYDYYRYAAFGDPNGITFRAVALCVPSSTASAQFTQTPPKLSTAMSGSITFNASDSTGESITLSCYLDGVLRGCVSGSPNSFGPLVDGSHSYDVSVHNQYGSTGFANYTWTIDATPPSIASHSPTSGLGLSSPLTITFSEPVTGVSASSVTVHAKTANVDLAGMVARPTSSTATWTPKTRLVPGETYRVTFSNAIHDTAGNAMTPTFFDVRAATVVDSTSAALLESWDVDHTSVASGGAFISSHQAGSRADLTFTATAGQTVSVYGIRIAAGGYADIYLDGIKKVTASFYAATTTRVRVYLSGALTAGTHILSVRPLGTKPTASSGTWVSVDNLMVGATIKEESTLTQRFLRTTAASAYGGSYEVAVHKTDGDTANPRFSTTVVGTGVAIYATKTPTSGSAKVYVDGILKATISLTSASTVYQARVYSGSFTLGVHTIALVAVGTSTGTNSDVDFDRLTVS